VVTDDFIQYTKDLGLYFAEHFQTLGGTVLFEESYTQGAADFSAQLARIKALPEQRISSTSPPICQTWG